MRSALAFVRSCNHGGYRCRRISRKKKPDQGRTLSEAEVFEILALEYGYTLAQVREMTRRELWMLLEARRSRLADYPEQKAADILSLDDDQKSHIEQIAKMRFEQLRSGKYDQAVRD